jgi:glucose-6-phosphate isomerase
MLNLVNITRERLGANGLDWNTELDANASRLEAARDAILLRRDDPTAWLGWMRLPDDQALLEDVEQLAASLKGQFDDLIVLGIGGSSLGGLTVITALQHPYRMIQTSGNGVRAHFVDNVDGDVIHGLLEVLNPRRTLVNVISKSGTTTETMAAYLACKTWLQNAVGDAWTNHIVATTDAHKGILRPMVQKYGFKSLRVPADVGGRYSVFCPVGTFPALMAGLDVRALLRGAARANTDFLKPAKQNDALQFALVNALFAAQGKNMTVLMPYSTRLRYLPDWFAQLWAESLGKRASRDGQTVHAGTTPIKTIGTTDQHSQVQLYSEGPTDKLFTFVRVAQSGTNAVIPDAEPTEPDMNYLGGKTFHTLLNAEQSATANALRENGKPNLTIELESVSEEPLGYLLQTLMYATAVMGELWNIDAFDQPGVELGKKFTYALMGRPGFEQLARELREAGVEA